MRLDKEFNKVQICKIEELLKENRDAYKVDLHIHTEYSADGTQTVEQAIEKAINKKFDIISITDHDSIDAYNEIIDKQLYNRAGIPIIIPGIEFTVSSSEYKGRCHVLKYFFDGSDTLFNDNLLQNKNAFINRVSIWFNRLRENQCMQYFFEKYGIICSKTDYWNFLNDKGINNPDYPTIMLYLFTILNEKSITVWDVYWKMLSINETDFCNQRKELKKRRLDDFYTKYHNQEIGNNYRKLGPLIAPVGIDDYDYMEFPSSGSLSVNEYGQVPIHALQNSGINVLAHPDIEQLQCIDLLLDCISGVELNCHSNQKNNEIIRGLAKSKGLVITNGSDKHTNTEEFYEELSFYDLSHNELTCFLKKVKQSLL